MTIEDIALTLQPGLGHKGVIHLMSVYGSAEAVFAASAQEIVERCGPTLRLLSRRKSYIRWPRRR